MVSKNFIKRIESIEKKVVTTKVPILIMIWYDWSKRKFAIKEQYFKKGGKSCKEKIFYYNFYNEYVIPPEYEGTVILDLYDCPEEFQSGLFSFNVKEIKQKEKIEDHSIRIDCTENKTIFLKIER